MDRLKIYNILDSTNKEAHRLLADGVIPDGFTLMARHQMEGRGQFGRLWIAAPGSHLAMTIIHKPENLTSVQLPTLGMKVSLGIIRALKDLEPSQEVRIKWPNDIYAKGKKLAGILVENSISGSRIQHSVIGIGMNVNETYFPKEIPYAISLSLLTGKAYDLTSLVIHLRDAVLDALTPQPENWKEEYNSFLFGLRETHTFEYNGSLLEGKILGVSAQGKLILEKTDGTAHDFYSHEIKWLVQKPLQK